MGRGFAGVIWLLAFCFSAFSYGAELKVLTFNAWAVRTPLFDISEDTDDRVTLMPDAIAATGADIVILQEVWDSAIRTRLTQELGKRGYSHSVQTDGSAVVASTALRLGNGLLIVSKQDLDPDVELLQFSKHTRADEAFLTKGAIKTRVDVPDIGWVDLYATHLGAVTFDEKTGDWNAKEARARETQSEELADFIVKTRSDDQPAILGADLNVPRAELAAPHDLTHDYELLTSSAELGLTDTYAHLHAADVDSLPPTFDTKGNPYLSRGTFGHEPPTHIDYIFSSPLEAGRGLEPVQSEIVLENAIPKTDKKKYKLSKLPLRVSDHYGVLTTFEVRS